MAEDTCLVCGRDGALPGIRVCGDCIGFAGDMFQTTATAIREGRVPLDSVNWSSLVNTALRIATRGDEVSETTDQVLEIVENGTRIAESLWAVTDEIRTALDGGQADTDRIAGAINDGVAVVFGDDAASRLVQAGIRVTLDLLDGDSPSEVLRGLIKELLPGWMMTDLWLDQLFKPPEPPKLVIPEHAFLPTTGHRWQPSDGGPRCEACGFETTMADLATVASQTCPDANEDLCMMCDEPRQGHSGEVDDALSGRLDTLADEYLDGYRAALAGEPHRAEAAFAEAQDTFFGRVGQVLDDADEKDATAWLAYRFSTVIGRTVADIAAAVSARAEDHEAAWEAWMHRSMDQLPYPITSLAPPNLDPMALAEWGQFAPGDPTVLSLVLKWLPEHPVSRDHEATFGGTVEVEVARRAVSLFKEAATGFGEQRGHPIHLY